MNIPLKHKAEIEVLGNLAVLPTTSIEDETPLIGADRAFAIAHGGPITRSFIESLPISSDEPLIVDTSLVWLVPGLAHGFELGPSGRVRPPRGPLRYTHEPFPGIRTGIRGESNQNRNAVSWLCVLGLDCTVDIVLGDWEFLNHSEANDFWLPTETLDNREALIQQRLHDGSLRKQSLPVGSILQFTWGTLMQFQPATTSGFQFALRATMGDPRPPINGRRNLSIL